MKSEIKWIHIPSGYATIGSNEDDMKKAAEFWKDKLLNPTYGREKKFQKWLYKEYPSYQRYMAEFYISDTLITNDLFQSFCDDTGHPYPESLTNPELGGGKSHPAWGMDIEEALDCCKWLSGKLGYDISIPNEEQWEYAARGSTRNQYPWGDEFNSAFCNTHESGIEKTTPVRHFEKGKSYFGLYDMGGNVEEWVNSTYHVYEGGHEVIDDLTETLGRNYHILKGGSFARGGDLCRVARRHGKHPDPVFRFTGFRLITQQKQKIKVGV
ncbi:formylglycine-generating enzyme family protein [Bacillus sp. NPDC077027]|uniref:formylglycine-generating enzyme family protein n=1 Tax=Bacillus sp. NPDC077027 TaxID=3390548 RepID=UPI003D02C995